MSLKHTAPQKKWSFYAVMWSLPVLFFALLEGGLQIAGFGQDYPLFVPVEVAPDYLVMNREVSRRYFRRETRVPTGLHDAFRMEKDTTTKRIFVQGGSSAAGYPYYYGGSFSRMLEQRLQQSFPNMHIEVVNVAMAAINSYTILDQVDDILDHLPDAVLIYAGHNEFYGALGIGSSQSLGYNRFIVNLYLRLQSLRILQLIQDSLSQVLKASLRRQDGSSTLMERMVGRQSIPLDSEMYRHGVRQFRGNLQSILRKYQRQGVPVFIGTVASNERTHPPFQNGLRSETDPDQWQNAYAIALADQSLPSSINRFQHLIAMDSMAATSWFGLATRLDARGDIDEARQAYIHAKDLDQLRFRATEETNHIIQEEALRASATLVDIQDELRKKSQDQIIGSDLMLEHLHPNLEGYFIFADAFYNAIYESKILGESRNYIPAGIARTEVLFTEIDSIFGELRLKKLLNSWPFKQLDYRSTLQEDTSDVLTFAEELAHALDRGDLRWFAATDQLRSYYASEGQHHHALKASLALLQEFPYLPLPYAYAGDALTAQGRFNEAVEYYRAANDLEESPTIHFNLGLIFQRKKEFEIAQEHFERAVSLDSDIPEFQLQLARNYILKKDLLMATHAVEALLELDPNHEDGLRLYQLLKPSLD